MERANPAAPCDDLDNQQHDLYRYLTAKRKRNGIVGPLSTLNTRSRIYPRTIGDRIPRIDIGVLVDEGFIQREDGDLWGYYRVLIDCPHPSEKISGWDQPITGQVAPRPIHTVLGTRTVCVVPVPSLQFSLASRSGSASRSQVGMEESALMAGPITQLRTHYDLIRYFAQVCPTYDRDDDGILRRNFGSWLKQGLPLKLQQAMVDEFIQHPDWCSRSRRGAALVFATHKTELLAILRNKERRQSERSDTAIWSFGKK